MAMDKNQTKAHGKQAKKQALRKLEKAQSSHLKAEHTLQKLRVKVERKEVKLARSAQKLLAIQEEVDKTKARPSIAPPVAAPNGNPKLANGAVASPLLDAAGNPIKGNGAGKRAGSAKAQAKYDAARSDAQADSMVTSTHSR